MKHGVDARHNLAMTRRSFLSAVAAGSTLTGIELAAPTNLLAANEAPTNRPLLPDFVAGLLTGIDGKRMILYVAHHDPDIVDVQITGNTEFYRGGSESWQALRLGDRVEVATYNGPGGVRVAQWVVANMIAGFATITAIEGNTLVIQTDYMNSARYEPVIYPYTRVSAGGQLVIGRADVLKVGDRLHFTAGADDPNYFAEYLMGYMIHRIDSEPLLGSSHA